jgi:hypothetical protein
MEDARYPLFRTMAAAGAAGALILLCGLGLYLYYQPIDQQATHAPARITGVFRYDPASGQTLGAKTGHFSGTEIPAARVDWSLLPPDMVVAAHWYDSNGIVEGGVAPATAAAQRNDPIPIAADNGEVAEGGYVFVVERYAGGRPVEVLARAAIKVDAR